MSWEQIRNDFQSPESSLSSGIVDGTDINLFEVLLKRMVELRLRAIPVCKGVLAFTSI